MDKKIVAFGEILLRLTPPDKNSIISTNSFSAFYGGSESNVLVALSSLGNKTMFVSALPDNELGLSAIKHLNSYGVDCSLVKKSGDTLGMYFVEEGFGERPSKVIYSRKYSEITHLSKEDFNFDDVFSDCGLFHISGISFALSESVKKLCMAFLNEAKKRKIKVSFDFNYRSKLWSIEEARGVFKKIIPYADIVFCSEKDIKTFLDAPSISSYFEIYPETEYLIVREREVITPITHKIKADIYRGENEVAGHSWKEFSVMERIGGGDAFDAGILHSLMKEPDNLKRALDFGVMCFILKHTIKGDVLPFGENEICAHLSNFSKDVRR